MLANNVEDLPEILKKPLNYKQAAPPELTIGDIVTNERSLRDCYPTVTIKYTDALSTFVIIDKNGVIRFRPKRIDAEQLETIIDSLNSPDDAAFAEKVQNIDVAEAS